jgi:hypothetical protein
VYVAITSLEPLMAYVHTGGVLLRFCSQNYVRDIKPDTPTNSYVIYGLDDYTPATQSEPHLVGNADCLCTCDSHIVALRLLQTMTWQRCCWQCCCGCSIGIKETCSTTNLCGVCVRVAGHLSSGATFKVSERISILAHQVCTCAHNLQWMPFCRTLGTLGMTPTAPP